LLGKHFQSSTGELFTVISVKDGKVTMSLFGNTKYCIEGDLAKFDEWCKSTGSEEISEETFRTELETFTKCGSDIMSYNRHNALQAVVSDLEALSYDPAIQNIIDTYKTKEFKK